MENDIDDKYMKEMLRLSSGSFPYSDFEDEVMLEIKAYERRKLSIRKNLKMSWLFFALGMVAGIFLLALLPDWQIGVDYGSMQLLQALWMIGCFLLLLLLGKGLADITNKYW